MLAGFVMLAMLGLIIRLAYVSNGGFSDIAEDTQRRIRTPVASYGLRGTIADRDGNPFVISEPSSQVFVDPRNVTDIDRVVEVLASTLGVSAEEIRSKIMDPSGKSSTIARQIDPQAAQEIKNARLAGVTVANDNKRVVVSGDIARALIGRMDKWAEVAQSGLEHSENETLSETDGQRIVERGINGRVIPGSESDVTSVRDGLDLWLTIDRFMQLEAERALADQLATTNAAGATAIVGNPRTGEIYAMASVERSDHGPVSGSLNLAVRSYEPGSVMKAVTVSAAFDQQIATPDSLLTVPDHIRLYDKTVRDHDPHPTETMTVSEIVAQSSNVGTIKLAQQVGKDGLLDYLRRFGFGAKSPLDLFSELSGEVKDHWNGTDIMSIPIGQSITATPLQIWSAYNAIANDGLAQPPMLVKTEIDQDGNSIDIARPPAQRVMSEDAARNVTDTLKKVVADGTGKQWSIPGYSVAAKTGTAYQPVGDGTYGSDQTGRKYAASFVGYFPADDPQISIMVALNEPEYGKHMGSVAAGPVFERLALAAIQKYAIPAETDEASEARAAAAAKSSGIVAPSALQPRDGTALGASSLGVAAGARKEDD